MFSVCVYGGANVSDPEEGVYPACRRLLFPLLQGNARRLHAG